MRGQATKNRLTWQQKVLLAQWLRIHDEALFAHDVTHKHAAAQASETLEFNVTSGNMIGMRKDMSDLKWSGGLAPAMSSRSKTEGVEQAVIELIHIVAALAKDIGCEDQARRAFDLLEQARTTKDDG